MPIAGTHLTGSGTTSPTTSVNTASIAPTGNRLVLATVQGGSGGGTAPPVPTLTGNGLTWVQVATVTFTDGATETFRLTVFRAMGASPSAGVVNIAHTTAPNASLSWTIREYPDVLTTGTHGANAVRNPVSATGTGTAVSRAMAAYSDATNNGADFSVGTLTMPTITPEAGGAWTGYTQQTWFAAMRVMWRLGEDTTATATLSASAAWAAIAIELVAAPTGGPAEQSAAGTVTPAGTLTKQVLKSASGSVTPSAALSRAAAKLFGGSTAPIGALQRHALKVHSGTLTPAGELAAVRALLHTVDGTVTPAGALQRAPAKVAAGTVTPAGAIARDVGKVATGAVSPTGALTKASTRALTGTVTPSGTLSALRTYLRAVAGTVGLSGAVVALRDVISQAVAGAIALGGALTKRAGKSLAGSVASTGTSTRAVWKVVAGELVLSGVVARQPRKVLTATIPLTGVTVTVAGTFAEPGPHPLTIRFERHGKTIAFELHGKRIQFVKHQKTIDFEP